MQEYKPTFTPTTGKRRLKPAAYIAIGVAVLSLVVCLACGVTQVAQRTRDVEDMPPVDVSTPTPEPTPVLSEAEGVQRAPWADQLFTEVDPVTEKEYLQAPPEVQEAVKKAYIDGVVWVNEQTTPEAGFRVSAEGLTVHHADPVLSNLLNFMGPDAELPPTMRQIITPPQHVEVKGFSPDGLSCKLAHLILPGGEMSRVWDTKTGELIREEPNPPGLLVYLMIYDLTDRRWKGSQRLEAIPYEELAGK